MGTVLEYCLTLILELEMLMNKKGKVVAELRNEKWLWDLTLLCDISPHFNYLNIKLQSQSSWNEVELFRKQLENVSMGQDEMGRRVAHGRNFWHQSSRF
jgi:hypothetical protein